MMKKPALLFLLLYCFAAGFSQQSLLQSGPMVGYGEMREVMLWVQTNAAAKVQIRYWEQEDAGTIFETDAVVTDAADGFTAHLLADAVLPGKHYSYSLLINDQQLKFDYPLAFHTPELWQWRKDPPTFTFALGSCAFINDPDFERPGKGYGGDYHIFQSIYEKHPLFMIWLGDNVYYREADWNTRTGMIYRNTHTRSIPEMQPLLGSIHHYAVWDDHDFGPNDADGSFIFKESSEEVFNLFWANPVSGLPGEPGITSYFEWGDCAFFLLDDRYFRSPNYRKTGERTMIGEAQLQWLISAMKVSKANFKFVCIGGQFVNDLEKYETYENLFPDERRRIIELIETENIKNVIFLDGDRHHTELSALPMAGGDTLWDFTVSPLTSGAYNATEEQNSFRVPGTMVGERNFALVTVSGPASARELVLAVYDSEGDKLWEKRILRQ